MIKKIKKQQNIRDFLDIYFGKLRDLKIKKGINLNNCFFTFRYNKSIPTKKNFYEQHIYKAQNIQETVGQGFFIKSKNKKTAKERQKQKKKKMCPIMVYVCE